MNGKRVNTPQIGYRLKDLQWEIYQDKVVLSYSKSEVVSLSFEDFLKDTEGIQNLRGVVLQKILEKKREEVKAWEIEKEHHKMK